MGYYPAFPPAIPRPWVGCIRVTHPCATLMSRRTFTVRLACIRPAASVHPEPGSNSSLYYCCTKCFSESRVPLCVPCLPDASASRRCACCLLLFFLLASDFQRTQNSLLANPSPLPFCGCKSTTFLQTDKHFFLLFCKIILTILYIKEINFSEKQNI